MARAHTSVDLKEWSTYIQPQTDGKVLIESEVQNNDAEVAKGRLTVTLYDASGKVVGRGKQKLTVANGTGQTVHLNINIKKPHLWSPETPYLYKAVLTMTDDNHGTSKIPHRFISLWGILIWHNKSEGVSKFNQA